MTFGYSRDDVAKFLPMYHDKGILQHDPFGLLRLDCVGNMEESHPLLHSLLKQDLIMFLVLPSGFPLPIPRLAAA
ncbi:hypothetical protein HA466_0254430 [Hirschfeldia incana]|nr:hypothetical protein HA466_0254430 [Hirschfeldia incana]